MGILLHWTRITPLGKLEWEARQATSDEVGTGDVFLDDEQFRAVAEFLAPMKVIAIPNNDPAKTEQLFESLRKWLAAAEL